MQVGNPSLSLASRCVIALLALLSLGPMVTGLDLLFHFLPTNLPAMQNLHTASAGGQVIWVSAGFVGVAAILLMLRWPVPAVVACIAFAATYIPGANAVWRYFTFGCWLAIAIVVLSVVGACAGSRQVRGLR